MIRKITAYKFVNIIKQKKLQFLRYKSVRVFINISMSKNKEFSIKKEKKKDIEKIDKKKSY